MEKNFARRNFIGEKKRKKEIFFFLLEKHQQLDAIQDESGEKRASPIVFVDWAQKTRQQNKKERKKERKKETGNRPSNYGRIEWADSISDTVASRSQSLT